MRAVMSEVPPHILEWRRRTGADRRDEVWDGVLHMAPEPGMGHQELALELMFWLRLHWARPFLRRVMLPVNVSRRGIRDWTRDFRVPDLVLLSEEGECVVRDTWLESGPDVVVEIRSPGDETYEKLPFYAAVGCREVWVIDADSRACEVYAVVDGEPRRRGADASGWTVSAVGVELRTEDRRLVIRMAGEDHTTGRLP